MKRQISDPPPGISTGALIAPLAVTLSPLFFIPPALRRHDPSNHRMEPRDSMGSFIGLKIAPKILGLPAGANPFEAAAFPALPLYRGRLGLASSPCDAHPTTTWHVAWPLARPLITRCP